MAAHLAPCTAHGIIGIMHSTAHETGIASIGAWHGCRLQSMYPRYLSALHRAHVQSCAGCYSGVASTERGTNTSLCGTWHVCRDPAAMHITWLAYCTDHGTALPSTRVSPCTAHGTCDMCHPAQHTARVPPAQHMAWVHAANVTQVPFRTAHGIDLTQVLLPAYRIA